MPGYDILDTLTEEEKEEKRKKQVIIDTIMRRSTKDGDCLIWTGSVQKGSCRLTFAGGKDCNMNVRNILYLETENYQIQHRIEHLKPTCSNERCIQPKHMERIIAFPKNDKKLTKERLTAKSIVLPNCCWQYQKITKRRPTTRFNKKSVYVNRLMYWTKSEYDKFDDLPTTNEDGTIVQVAHTCGSFWCFNPDHLELKTIFENNYDDKKRHGTIKEGKDNHWCKYSDDIIKQVIADKGILTVKQRSEKYNVSKCHIRKIDRGMTRFDLTKKSSLHAQRLKKAKTRTNAKKRMWTSEMFESAKSKLEANSRKQQTKEDLNECWLSNYFVNPNGYARMMIFGKDIAVHVLAGEINSGRHKQKGEVARHLCDVKVCCRPDHVMLGSQKENMADRDRNGHKGHYKLNFEKAEAIRKLRKEGVLVKDIAKQFGVGKAAISRVIYNRSYIN